MVDRLARLAVPVRGARRPGRSRTAGAGRLLRNPSYGGTTPGVLGLARRRLLALRVAARIAHRLRQGRAGAVRCTCRTAARRPASGTWRWAWRERAPTLAERALERRAAADGALAAVNPRALADAALRRARDPRRPLRGRPDRGAGHGPRRARGPGGDQPHRRRRPRRLRAQGGPAAAEAAARGGGPGRLSPASPSRRRRARTTATTRPPPRSTPDGRAALAAAFAVAGAAGVEAHGAWTRRRCRRRSRPAPAPAAADRVTDAFMKVICIAPGGRSGYAARAGGRRGRARRRSAGAPARPARPPPAATPAALPPGEYPVVHGAARRRPSCSTCSACTAFNGLAYAEGRGALEGRLGTRVAAPAINLSDSPRFPRTLPRAFDAEGVRRRRCR